MNDTYTVHTPEQLAPGTVIRVEVPAGVLVGEVGYHDVAVGGFVVRFAGFPGWYWIRRTALRSVLTFDECEQLGFDGSARGLISSEYEEVDDLDDTRPLITRALLDELLRVERVWLRNGSSPAPLDVASAMLTVVPGVTLDAYQLADLVGYLGDIALLPVEIAENVALIVCADDPASQLEVEIEVADDERRRFDEVS